MSDSSILFYILIMLIACLYSFVGHGGASGYLALMSLLSLPMTSARPVALVLNMIVSLIAFIQFYRRGYFDKKIFIALAIASIPAAYFGGLLTIDDTLYKQILGILLAITAIRLLIPFKKEITLNANVNIVILFIIGAGIGFASGIIGIGGGIILSPILILLRYTDVKTTSGISALFIFVNSIAGLLGQIKQGASFSSSMIIMITVAVIGGFTGSYFGAKHTNQLVLKKVLAIVLIIASFKLVLI
jgi:uncharacterized membrane protein YfcA